MKILNPKFEEADKIFSDAITDISNIDRCVKYVNMKRLYIGDYVELWDRVDSIMKEHGLNLTTAPLLATVCSIPSQKLKKEVEKLAKNFDLKNKLSEDKELAEELFFALQSSVQNYYFAQKTRLMSKALLKKVLKMLVIACDAFGFGLQPHGLVTVIRIFENSGVEGICLESYRADEVYDEEEYGFYGSEDNEIYYDEFWSTINIEDLIKQL